MKMYKYREQDYINKLLKYGLGDVKSLSYELRLLAKHCKNINMTKNETRRFLYEAMKSKEYDNADDYYNHKIIKNAIKKGYGKPIVQLNSIALFQDELDIILNHQWHIDFKKFSLSCLIKNKLNIATYNKFHQGEDEYKHMGKCVFSIGDKMFNEIFKNTKLKRKNELLAYIRDCIQMGDVVQLGYNVFEISPLSQLEVDKSNVYEVIPNLNFVDYSYLIESVFDGKMFTECEQCGVKLVKKSNRQKYCKECANEIQLEQMRNFMRNKRANMVDVVNEFSDKCY